MTIETELRGRLKALEAQRERALTDHALTEGALAVANAEKGELAARVRELEDLNRELEAQVIALGKPQVEG